MTLEKLGMWDGIKPLNPCLLFRLTGPPRAGQVGRLDSLKEVKIESQVPGSMWDEIDPLNPYQHR